MTIHRSPRSRARALALALSVALTGPAGAEGVKTTYQVAYESWSDGNAFKDNKSASDAALQATPGAMQSKTVNGAEGGRISLLWRTAFENVKWGLCFSHVEGPRGSFIVTDGANMELLRFRGRYDRLMLELNHTFKLGKGFGLRTNLAWGYALGDIRSNIVIRGSRLAAGGYTGVNVGPAVSMSGWTYEVGPSVVYNKERLGFSVGLIYAHFPGHDGGLPAFRAAPTTAPTPYPDSSQLKKFKYDTLGLKIGVEF